MTINREMITEAMQNIPTCCEKINSIISPNKRIQAHKGVRLDTIHVTSEGCWSKIIFPQWVVLENSFSKSYQFNCTESGEFISWVGGGF